ncbi:MAG: peptidoglycan-binding protein, partial [Acidobacteria bacterium]|nr:peptidoglycan-binding protein [Acidobacteriota bacterium]
MSKILLGRGAKGELVRRLQQNLQRQGFDPGGIDGDFGEKITEAVSAFQGARNLPSSGDVDVTTWQHLMRVPIPPVRDRSLQVSADFEGHGFHLVQGNWDGAGLTWGIIGFTLKQGEIQKILLEIHGDRPDLFEQAFGNKVEDLLTLIEASRAEQMRWADSISRGPKKVRVAEPWRSAFRKLGEMEEVQRVQLRLADQDYFRPSLETAKEQDLNTELGIALAFDIHVQNGGIKPTAAEQIRKVLTQNPVSSELERRVIIAHAVADKARPEFREDVRSRKLTL